MTIMKLGTGFTDCPKCWQNFIDYVRDNAGINDDNDGYLDDETLNQYLKEYDAVYFGSGVMFDLPQSYLLFNLKWS